MPERKYPVDTPLARALDVVGGRWALLVVDALLGHGPRRFNELTRDLQGIATNLLAERLRQLERDGVVERALMSDPQAAVGYQLTAKGRELKSVVTELAEWGAGPATGGRRQGRQDLGA